MASSPSNGCEGTRAELHTTGEEEDDQIPLACLQKLANSSDLKAMLHNKHLQRLLMEVDNAHNKAAVVEKFMQEPLFVEFADQCLAIVNPEEKAEK